ncbi:MAG: hypothetical protein J3K34DRAFT_510696 [Monoraphidium minutum]|nr:MAG: hypothetical protein J3K34DRAFT_510696 [Monoraphidium minutum]
MDPNALSSVRTVRPRPLGVDERIPVFWSGREAAPELRAVDGGALFRYLVASTPKTGQKRARSDHQAVREAPASGGGGGGQKSRKRDTRDVSCLLEARIHVPHVRLVPDYHRLAGALQPKPTFAATPGGALAVPYVRWHPPLPGMYDDKPPEYDVDEADEAWLHKANADAAGGGGGAGGGGRGGGGRGGAAGRGGIMAAARGLYKTFSDRFRSSSGGGFVPESAAHRGSDTDSGGSGGAASSGALSVTEFERAIEKLELLHFAAVTKWWNDLNDGPSTSAPTQAPKIPPTKTLLPKVRTLEELAEIVPDRRLAGLLYDHWHKRRQQHGGPLLERLWFEVPWKFVAFAHLLGEEEGDDELLPFMAGESRSAKRRAGARRRVNDEDALEALHALRSELEVVRTLADQVRKREKTKRLLLQLWQKETRLRLHLGDFPPQPPPLRIDSRELPHWGHGIGHPLGRGATSSRAPSRPATPAADSDYERDDLQLAGYGGGATGEPALNRRGRPARAAAAAANAGIHASVLAEREPAPEDLWAAPPSHGGRGARAYAPPTAAQGGGLAYAAAGAGGSDGEGGGAGGPTWGQKRRRDSPHSTPRQRRQQAGGRRGTVTFARAWEDSSDGERERAAAQRRGRGRGGGRGGSILSVGRGRVQPHEEEEEAIEEVPLLQAPPKRQRGGGPPAAAVEAPSKGAAAAGRQKQRQKQQPEPEPVPEPEAEAPPKQQQRGPKKGRPGRAAPPRGAEAEDEDEEEDGGGRGAPAPEPGKLVFKDGVATFTTPEGRVLFGASARSAAAGALRRAAEEAAAAAEARRKQGPKRGAGSAAGPQKGRRKAAGGQRRGAAAAAAHEDADGDDEGGSGDEGGVESDASTEFAGDEAEGEQQQSRKGRKAPRGAAGRAQPAAAPQAPKQQRGRKSAKPSAPEPAPPAAPARKAGAVKQAGGRKQAAVAAAAAKSLARPSEPKDSQSCRPAALAAAAVRGATARARGGARAAAPARQRRGAAAKVEAEADDHRGARGVGKRELRDLGINQDALDVAASWRHLFKPN